MTESLPAWIVASLLGVWVLSAGLIIFGIAKIVQRISVSALSRLRRLLASTGIFLVWSTCVVLLARAGAFELDRHTGLRVPIPLVMVGTIVLAYSALRIRAWRDVVLATPNHWLVAIQGFRMAGVVMLVAGIQGLLPRAFAIPAALGDCLVGLSALPVAAYVSRHSSKSAFVVRAWNYLGILDLLMAGILGFALSPLRLSRFPLVMIPALRVPLAYTLHLYSLRIARGPSHGVGAPT